MVSMFTYSTRFRTLQHEKEAEALLQALDQKAKRSIEATFEDNLMLTSRKLTKEEFHFLQGVLWGLQTCNYGYE